MKNETKLAPARSFEDLIVWQRAHEFVLATYKFTDGFPQKEMYGLTSQFRRGAISIAANISEGFKKTGVSDKLRFLNIAQGSVEECRYYLILSRDLGYGDISGLQPLMEEVSKLLESYSGAIRRNRAFKVAGFVLALGGLAQTFSWLFL
jgi:four helix bundle protein